MVISTAKTEMPVAIRMTKSRRKRSAKSERRTRTSNRLPTRKIQQVPYSTMPKILEMYEL